MIEKIIETLDNFIVHTDSFEEMRENWRGKSSEPRDLVQKIRDDC